MLGGNNFFVLVSLGLILMSSKCSQTKLIYQSTPPFKILRSYAQKQVPGDQTRKPYYEIGLDVSGLNDSILLDSIFYTTGKSISINEDGLKRIKMPSAANEIEKEALSAILYYRYNDVRFYHVISKIDLEEPIYLP